ncbi:MAG: hypothetical protein LBV30_00370 [Propionibacteriaceae bacterium]|nr:hypothetical protein [Propionibacteriaceae bacterium]
MTKPLWRPLLMLTSLGAAAGAGWWWLAHGRRGHADLADFAATAYAHRGLHCGPDAPPENSLPAFEQALEAGYGVELDVHLTADDRLVVIHDSDLNRLCGLDRTIESLTTAEIEPLRLEGSDQPVPFLEQVLPLFEGRGRLLIEIKPVLGNHADLTRRTVDCLDRFNVAYAIESFDPRVLLWLRFNRPDILRGQLTQDFRNRALRHGDFDASVKAIPWLIRFMLTMLMFNVAGRPDFAAEKLTDRRNPSYRRFWRRWGGQGVYWTIRDRAEADIAAADHQAIIFEGFRP